MQVEVWNGADTSLLIVDNQCIVYTRKTHRYESECDYKTLTTELNTYGERAALSVLLYLKESRNRRVL